MSGLRLPTFPIEFRCVWGVWLVVPPSNRGKASEGHIITGLSRNVRVCVMCESQTSVNTVKETNGLEAEEGWTLVFIGISLFIYTGVAKLAPAM
jgi:hypothetical protein